MQKGAATAIASRLGLGDPGKEVINVAELIMDHKGKKTHLGGTSLVQFLGTELVLLFLAVVTDESDRERGGREISREGSLSLLPSGKLKETSKGQDLKSSSNGDLGGSLPSRGNVRELQSRGGDFTRKADSGIGDEVSNNTELADTSVLDLNGTEAVEALLVGIGEEAKGIEESEGWLDTELVLEGVEGSGGLAGLGRGEGGGRGNEGGEDSELHGGSECEIILQYTVKL